MRGSGRIFQRGNIWWVAYSHRGKEHRESSGSRKEADAKRFLKKRLGEIHAQTFIGPSQERVKVSELLDGVIRDYKLNERKSLHTLEHNCKHLREAFGFDRAIDVTETRIERYKERRLSEAAAPASLNRELAVLRRAFNLGVKQKIVNRAPTIEMLKERNVREGFVERADFEALAKHMPEYLRDFARFGFLVGWRLREIASLSWAEVDLEERLLWLRIKNSKNSRGRMVALEGDLYDLILKRLKLRAVTSPTGETMLSRYVFHRGDGKVVGDF
ncbi:MAG: tyrosine-type recombinase/integrase, partial [Planctomycetota bacterium]